MCTVQCFEGHLGSRCKGISVISGNCAVRQQVFSAFEDDALGSPGVIMLMERGPLLMDNANSAVQARGQLAFSPLDVKGDGSTLMVRKAIGV